MQKLQNKFLKEIKYKVFINDIRIFSHLSFRKINFSSKDDAFWQEYSKRKIQGGRVPALESQEIIYNKTIHSWKFSDNHALTPEDLISALRDLEPGRESPFYIVDVREEIELDLYKLPLKTKRGVKIPIIYRNMNELNHGNHEDFPLDKYLVCIDSIGLRGRTAARRLTNEGYLTLYVEGGYDMFIPAAKTKEF